MDLGILNTVIALVIVLLVLSLLVQSVQTFIKKLLKLKSRQIADSLKDLYEQALSSETPAAPAEDAAASTTPPATNGTTPVTPAEHFKDRVLEQFKNIGRKTAFGRPVLDSLSKQDLFKVMGKLELEQFFPAYVAKFQLLCDHLVALRTAIEGLSNNEQLRGAASSKLAEIRAILAPIFTNVESVLEGKKIKEKVLFADLLQLGKLNVKELLGLLDEAQAAIAQEKATATQAKNTAEVQELETLSSGLGDVAKLIGDLTQKFDAAVSPLRHKIDQVEIWFDTVTQSFDERYARHMRTVSICISIVVVIVLNANFFRVYKSISTNEVQRNLIVDSGPEILKRASESRQASAQPTPTPSPSPTPTPAQSPANTTQPAAGTQDHTASTTKPSPSPTPTIKEEIERTRQEIDLLSNTYQGFGFTPLSGQQVRSFLWSTGLWTGLLEVKRKDTEGNANSTQGNTNNTQGNTNNNEAGEKDEKNERAWWGFTLARDEKGVPVNVNNEPVPIDCQEVDKTGQPLLDSQKRPMDCTPVWRLQTRGEWWESLKGDVVSLIGWAIMVLLLSAGAPFWQDALESLFGIKNLLRQRSATQNIEAKSGAGQPKE